MATEIRFRRGDTVTLKGSMGTVLRVARDGSWVDVGWWNSDGSYGWSKRQRKPEVLAHVIGGKPRQWYLP